MYVLGRVLDGIEISLSRVKLTVRVGWGESDNIIYTAFKCRIDYRWERCAYSLEFKAGWYNHYYKKHSRKKIVITVGVKAGLVFEPGLENRLLVSGSWRQWVRAVRAWVSLGKQWEWSCVMLSAEKAAGGILLHVCLDTCRSSILVHILLF